jgi:hypothetical protein
MIHAPRDSVVLCLSNGRGEVEGGWPSFIGICQCISLIVGIAILLIVFGFFCISQ